MAKKLYNFYSLKAVGLLPVLSIVYFPWTFVLLQTIQHQQLQTDWYDAGEITQVHRRDGSPSMKIIGL